jgi:VanZ family protein
MINKKHFSLRFLLVVFIIILAAMIFAGLHPFNFFPSNRVQWLFNESGLYFDGAGIAYTEIADSVSLKKAVSVELLLNEPRGSKNWGPREIFSFYDGSGAPSFLVGQWAGRIFFYSRLEKNKNHKWWYKIFRTPQRFPRGKAHLVTITFDEDEKAIYIDGQLSNKKDVELNNRTHIEFSGTYLLGNSYRRKNGWYGAIKGLVIYNRILLPDEIVTHSKKVFQEGVTGLAETPGCFALYNFDEGKGNSAKSILNKPRPFYIPDNLNSHYLSLRSISYKDMRFYGFNKADFLKNIAFFVPFGILLSAIIFKKYATSYLITFLLVALAGGLLSCVIEGFQIFLPSRAPGIADIFSNILGSGFGVLLTFIFLKWKA